MEISHQKVQEHTANGRSKAHLQAVLSRKVRGLRGQTLAEYALILAFISVVAITALLSMGGQVSTVYTTINRQLNDAQNGGVTGVARNH